MSPQWELLNYHENSVGNFGKSTWNSVEIHPSTDRPLGSQAGLCDFAGFRVAAQDDVLLLTTELPLGEFLFSKSAQHLLSGWDWILLQLHLLMWIDAEKGKNRVRGRS